MNISWPLISLCAECQLVFHCPQSLMYHHRLLRGMCGSPNWYSSNSNTHAGNVTACAANRRRLAKATIAVLNSPKGTKIQLSQTSCLEHNLWEYSFVRPRSPALARRVDVDDLTSWPRPLRLGSGTSISEATPSSSSGTRPITTSLRSRWKVLCSSRHE
jgi:hypothetical protein